MHACVSAASKLITDSKGDTCVVISSCYYRFVSQISCVLVT